jgi:phytoene synthase
MDSSQSRYSQSAASSTGSSFYYSFLFLNPAKRHAVTTLYAFCRTIDDIVDHCQDTKVAYHTLSWWTEEIERLFQGKPTHPLSQALEPIIHNFGLPKPLFIDLIHGMYKDLNNEYYDNFDALQVYCYHVASVPGLLAAKIFGYQNPQTETYARTLGIALQLINIIRDVGEDAVHRRIYLPQEELAQFSLTADDILNRRHSPQFDALMRFQAKRAQEYYQLALSQLPAQDRLSQQCGLIMGSIYFTLLHKIQKRGFPVLTEQVRLAPFTKLWVAWKTARTIRRQHD